VGSLTVDGPYRLRTSATCGIQCWQDASAVAINASDEYDPYFARKVFLILGKHGVAQMYASARELTLHTVDGSDLCRVHVPPSSFPVDAHVLIGRKASCRRKTAFFVRSERHSGNYRHRERNVQ
jgi:hypothetical protein